MRKRPFSFFVTLPGIEEWMIDERVRQSGELTQITPDLMGIGYYASFSNDINEIMANLTRKDRHERV